MPKSVCGKVLNIAGFTIYEHYTVVKILEYTLKMFLIDLGF